VKAGVPFSSRDTHSLEFPHMQYLPAFVCECCQVRVFLQREIDKRPHDIALLMLERMRLIDIGNHWASSTLSVYGSKLNRLALFERQFSVSAFAPTTILRPPTTPIIVAMWAQEQFSLQPGGRHQEHKNTVSFDTIRGVRSALSAFYTWNMLLSHGGCVFPNSNNVPVISPEGGRPTDDYTYTLFSNGMAKRLGEDSRPSASLRYENITYIDNYMHRMYAVSATDNDRQTVSRAALVNLFGWCGWLRGGELFGLSYRDVSVLLPADSAKHGLPTNVGALLLRLAPITKSSPSRTADVIIAYKTSSGLQPGLWWQRLCELHSLDMSASPCYIFTHANGAPWTSQYFRATYLLPLLNMQRDAGDPILSQYAPDSETSIEKTFWGFHSYRRGGRSFVERKQPGCVRAAFSHEIYEHGRWRLSRRRMDMPTRYLEMGLPERIAITMLCM
jgi:hypothetical protein